MPLDAQFAAAGFDAVIIVGAPPTEGADALAADFLAKPEFAPIVLLLLQDAPNPEPDAVPGVQRLYGRKIDRERLIRAIVIGVARAQAGAFPCCAHSRISNSAIASDP